MERPAWAPREVDLSRPSAARVYDYYLGGSHNFAVDRAMAEEAIRLWPDLPLIMQANRAFLRRAVKHLVQAGVRQFLDIGSGIPTVGNVHEVAQGADPSCRVVYVDSDPVAVAHSRVILAGNDRATIVQADMRVPEQVLDHPETRQLIDFSQPLAVLMVAVLHFVPDSDDPAGIVARYREAMPLGSYLAISHATRDGQPRQALEHQELYQRNSTPIHMRSREEILPFFAGFDLLEPGLVFLSQWRPESPEEVGDRPERFSGFAGVGRKV